MHESGSKPHLNITSLPLQHLVDDFVKVLIQVSRYYQNLKGEHTGTGPRKEELMLQVAQYFVQRSGNPKALNVAITKTHRTEEFCI